MSRPKKVILCVSENEYLLSQRTFLLETHGYRVLKAENAKRGEEILRELPERSLDVVLVHAPMANAQPLLRTAHEFHAPARTLVTSESMGYDSDLVHAEAYLPKGAWSPAELLERIKIMVARKPGPAKKLNRTAELAVEQKKKVA